MCPSEPMPDDRPDTEAWRDREDPEPFDSAEPWHGEQDLTESAQ